VQQCYAPVKRFLILHRNRTYALPLTKRSEPSTPVAQAYRTTPRRVRKWTIALIESLPGTASPLISTFHGTKSSTRRRNQTYTKPRPRGIEPSAPTTQIRLSRLNQPAGALHRATVHTYDTKITLTGYGTIDTQAQKPEGLDALLQHQFGKDWKWN